LVSIFNQNPTNKAATRLAHDVIDPPPEALVLLLVNYGQYLLLPFFILALLCISEAVVKVLPPVLLTMFPEVVALFQVNLKPLEDLSD
jgi:hypothetical protein